MAVDQSLAQPRTLNTRAPSTPANLAKTGICAECGARFRHRDLYEVGEDHLTYFEHDLLCESCAIGAGVI